MQIRAIHAEARGEYGWPRVWKELLARGIRVGKLMKLHGIRARGKRKFKATTDSNHGLPVAPPHSHPASCGYACRESKSFILETAVGQARGHAEAGGWQGATTKWAHAHEEEQRSQQSEAAGQRACSAAHRSGEQGTVSKVLMH